MSLGKELHKAIFCKARDTIRIAGEDVPIKFAIAALEEVQIKYGTLQNYEEQLKDPQAKSDDKRVIRIAPVLDGIVAMIHNGCMEKDYDLSGISDREIKGAIEGNFWELRNMVIEEFNKNFMEPDEDEKK